MNVAGIEEMVADKDYHSGAVVERVKNYQVPSYIPERQHKGRRNWATGRARPDNNRRCTRTGGGYRGTGQPRQKLIEETRRIGET